MNHPRRLVLSAAACVFLTLGGCATVTRGTTQVFTVDSTPLGATVSLSNGERCETPCALKLKRKHPFAVEVCKAGYAPVNTQILSQMSGSGGTALAGNIILGGLIGAGVDAGSGATKDLRPNPLTVLLVEAAPGCEAPSFPAVPDGGQTPEEYARKKPKGKQPKPASSETGTN